MSDDCGRSDHDDDLEFETDSTVGANQRQGEQFGDQPEEESQPVNQEQQRILNLVNTWSDEQLLEVEQSVKNYWKKRPPEPDIRQGQRYVDRLEELKGQQRNLQEQLTAQRERVEALGKPRSWRYPFGSSPEDVEVAAMDVALTQVELKEVKTKMTSIRQSFNTWQEPVKRFNKWRNSELGQSMHQAQSIIQLPLVQERLHVIHREQKRQKVLKTLSEWEKVAQNLDKSEAYRKRIAAVTEEYRQGIPLSEQAKQALTKDFETYQQRQRKLQQRSCGLSL
ncbi:MAG: hypothetical protein HC810_00725 [Acaryochloridaceae cyanobacterium RL_2_7]|nr:hypothetical protein [Acaryochloridaceae cyanobacterium RL_2_7]